jgi:hypothetical protein
LRHRHLARSGLIHRSQEIDGIEQRLLDRRAAELERLEERRRVFTQRREVISQQGQRIEGLVAGQFAGLGGLFIWKIYAHIAQASQVSRSLSSWPRG